MARWSRDSEVRIGPDIEGSPTLPSWYYTDPDVLTSEREQFFGTSWMYVCGENEVAEPGEFVTREIAGDEVIVTRDEDGDLQAFHNVCPHRGSRVVDDDCGSERKFQCPYHGWTFDLDGTLYSAPNFDDESQLDCEANSLHSVHLDTWGPMVFVTFADDPDPLEAQLGSIVDTLDPYRLDEFEVLDSYEYEIDCNWKVYVDNYIECDHCDLNHSTSLYEWVHPDTYEIEPNENHVLISATLREEFVANETLPDSVRDQYHAAWVWPNLTLDIANDGLEVGYLQPRGPEKMVLQADRYVRRGKTDQDWVNDDGIGRQVLDEDAELCERQQAGLASAVFKQGRIGPNEHGIHRFQRLVQNRLQA